MKVTLQDGRQMVGQMLAFDKVCHCRCYAPAPALTCLPLLITDY